MEKIWAMGVPGLIPGRHRHNESVFVYIMMESGLILYLQTFTYPSLVFTISRTNPVVK